MNDSVGKVTRYFPDTAWDSEHADTTTYDPCAPLSWIVLNIVGATGSSPYQIMAFHQGRYVGSMTKEAYGFAPRVTRTAPNAVSITYTFAQPGEGTANASGKATSTFTWDDASQSVVRHGDLPPLGSATVDGPVTTNSPTAPTGTPGGDSTGDGVPAEAYPGAGGPRPAGATPMEEGGTVIAMKSPSGNIGCDFAYTGEVGCGVKSFITDHKYPRTPVGYPWWFTLTDGRVPAIGPKGDVPYFDEQGVTVPFGTAAYFHEFVCGSAENGMTCWSTKTGHGVFLNRAGYTAF